MTKETNIKSEKKNNKNSDPTKLEGDSFVNVESDSIEVTGEELIGDASMPEDDLNEQKNKLVENGGNETKKIPDEQIQKAEEKYNEMHDRYLRLNAEFENYKKRMIRENTDRLKYFNLEIIKEMLPSLDNLERAISHAEDENSNTENMLKGLQMVYKGMQDTFGKFGVVKIDSFGKEFDPNCHQAVGMVENKEVPENHVAEELLTGYFLHDRIVRPTMVRVSGKE
jgi:molecular chaperone GrpE